MRLPKQTISRRVMPVIAGAFCMIALLSAANAVAQWSDQTPKIGDVIAFHALSQQQPFVAQRIRAQKADRNHCTLDVDTIIRSGGSFVIESFNEPDDSYRIHWAGERTAMDSTGCGAIADLVVDVEQLDQLEAAARTSAAGGVRVRVFDPFDEA